ncbi:MAG: hypothetical protein HYT41_00905 [Candidatus Sungbacteria bacterium]|nr:hypothetical protein [Candidatus Sungbacteria bacterium]
MQYINQGNALYRVPGATETPAQRADIFREAQWKWNGRHTIRYVREELSTDGDGAPLETEVFVHYIFARTRVQMRSDRERQRILPSLGLTVRAPHPFKAIIGSQGQSVGLEWLKEPV